MGIRDACRFAIPRGTAAFRSRGCRQALRRRGDAAGVARVQAEPSQADALKGHADNIRRTRRTLFEAREP